MFPFCSEKGEDMLRLKITMIGVGQHPSETVVSLTTADGSNEELIVDKRSVVDGTVKVGYPISRDGNRWLVELPRETVRGSWRVWVNKDSVEELKETA
jgi:hypothetical protein